MMKKIILIAILVAAVGGGFGIWKKKAADQRDAKKHVKLATVTRGPIEITVESTGEVSPLNRVEVKPPISGRIEKLMVDEGARVKAGDVLAWMSSSDRAAILDAARAQGAAEVKYWEDAYKPTPILAPLSGVIILRNVVVGQTVDGSTVLFAMSDRLMVLARVDEADIGRVKVGMKARITLDAYPSEAVEGHVSQILFEGKNVSNVITYGVKVEPERVPDFFRSQMTANVSLLVQRRDDALTLPSSAVLDDGGKKAVLLPVPDAKPAKREVTTGVDNGQSVEILSGLEEGQSVVVASTRYVPQKAEQTSPLTPTGPRRQGQGQGQRGSGGSGAGSRSR